jgi:hypothetical protein
VTFKNHPSFYFGSNVIVEELRSFTYELLNNRDKKFLEFHLFKHLIPAFPRLLPISWWAVEDLNL